MNRPVSVCCGLVLGLWAALGAAEAPAGLDLAQAYSTEIAPDGEPGPRHFPLTLLGSNRFRQTTAIGGSFNFTKVEPTALAKGRPLVHRLAGHPEELRFASCWSAHSLHESREVKGVGRIPTAVDEQGREVGQHWISLFSPQARDYVLQADRAAAAAMLAAGSRVLVWNIDNEWETPVDYATAARTAFRERVRARCQGDLERLNREWGSAYRSWDEVEPPATAAYRERPAAWLEWRALQEEVYAGFIAERFQAIQESDPRRRPVLSKSTQCMIEMPAVARKRTSNPALLAERIRPWSQGWFGIDIYGQGDRNCYELSYLWHCAMDGAGPEAERGARVFCCEINNHSGPGWQFAQSFWRVLAHGAKGLSVFTLGYRGAVGDWATFGLTEPKDGTRRDRFFAAARLFSTIRRSEAFWSEAAPAAVDRIAMLVPQRDIQLAETGGASRWDYPKNNRLAVYTALRGAGYWVDAIPYGRLDDRALAAYRALVLVDAEHLTAGECAAIDRFTAAGGVLLSDMRPGYYDELHQPRHGLDHVIGVALGEMDQGIDLSPDDLWYLGEGGDTIRTDGKVRGRLQGARLLQPADPEGGDKFAWVCERTHGQGRSLWFNTRLGLLRAESGDPGVVSRWFRRLLTDAGCRPGYQVQGVPATAIRVETPMTDRRGNQAVLVAGLVRDGLPAATIEIPAGGAAPAAAFISLADDTVLRPLPPPVPVDGGRVRIALPAIPTAAVVYLFRDHAPLLGLRVAGPGSPHPADPATLVADPGARLEVAVQVAVPAGPATVAGSVALAARPGWQVSPARIPVSAAPGSLVEVRFQVTVPADDGSLAPELPYPLVARWTGGGEAVGLAHVLVRPDPDRHEWLLSGNRGRAEDDSGPFAFVHPGRASYRWLSPADGVQDPVARRNPGQAATALLDGPAAVAKLPPGSRAEVEFDLGAVHRVARIRIARGEWARPTAIQVATSLDGVAFTAAPAVVPAWQEDWNGKDVWTEVVLPPVPARQVRVRLDLPPKVTATLDEIEIWGRPGGG